VVVSPDGGGAIQIDQVAPSFYPYDNAFDYGESINLEAVPAPGYRFDNWSGSLSGSTNPVTVVMDCNKSITANFTREMTVKANWPLVGGIMGGLMLMALLALVIRQRGYGASGGS
jgi:hypothetical protein